MNNKKGFTLIEIITVIAIIGILLSIAIPNIVLVKERINSKAYNTKKEAILLAAQLYGQDNPTLFASSDEIIITIGNLIEADYIEKDVDNTVSVCGSSYGCIIDPRDKSNMNNFVILIRNVDGEIYTVWQGEEGSLTNLNLVNAVLSELNCTPTSSSPCLYPENAMNNYLNYSEITWRILGVYVIDGVQVVKLITNDTINID